MIDKVAAGADLLISEGFIEPHFFAGFSGGRKSVLPGVCDQVTVLGNHCSRFIDSTSGWFRETLSDVDSRHIYFGKLRLGKDERPQLLSEFGGYVWKIPEHSFNTEKTFGYPP